VGVHPARPVLAAPFEDPQLPGLTSYAAASLTLAQLRQVLQFRDAGQPPWDHVRELLGLRRADLEAQIAELLALRETIAQLGAATSATEPDTCPPKGLPLPVAVPAMGSSSRHGSATDGRNKNALS